MEYLLSILAGVIQGVAEFLPISSSGHLVLFHDIFGFNLPDDLLFDVILHWGTLLALVWFFYRDIWQISRGFLASLTNWNLANDFNQRLAWLLVIGTIPAVIIGYFFEKFIVANFRSAISVAVMLIIGAILFWIFEKYSRQQRDIGSINKWDSLIIGGAQALALIPGVSRSGVTIIAGLGRNIKREDAAKFSFLLSIPVVFGAGLKEIFSLGPVSGADFFSLFLGFLFSALTGYWAIKFLLKYLSNHSLNIFAWYRLIIGCLILIWFFFR
ncbi:MAG: undecaprenyl-diphosphatase UppP [Patescibacteria group bacterium]